MASKRNVRRKGCEKKRAYDQDGAFWAARNMRRLTGDERIGFYRCSHCGKYHVGHKRYEQWSHERELGRRS